MRETPLESASFAYFVDHRVPLPRMQVVVTERDGEFVARVDFLWDADRLVGEADGRLKYQSADDLYREKRREKRREDALRALGYRVVRWGAADLRTADLARRLRVLLGA